MSERGRRYVELSPALYDGGSGAVLPGGHSDYQVPGSTAR